MAIPASRYPPPPPLYPNILHAGLETVMAGSDQHAGPPVHGQAAEGPGDEVQRWKEAQGERSGQSSAGEERRRVRPRAQGENQVRPALALLCLILVHKLILIVIYSSISMFIVKVCYTEVLLEWSGVVEAYYRYSIDSVLSKGASMEQGRVSIARWNYQPSYYTITTRAIIALACIPPLFHGAPLSFLLFFKCLLVVCITWIKLIEL